MKLILFLPDDDEWVQIWNNQYKDYDYNPHVVDVKYSWLLAWLWAFSTFHKDANDIADGQLILAYYQILFSYT